MRRSPTGHCRRPSGLAAVYETITGQLPAAGESDEWLQLVADLTTIYQSNPELAEQLCDDVQLQSGIEAPELAAWTMLVSALFNLDITKTRS